MPLIYDYVNQNAYSGTELMMRGLESRLNPELSSHFSIGRAIMLFKDDQRTRIYWTHNLPGQMGIKEVSEKLALNNENRWKFNDKIVFVSEWQKQEYIKHYNFDEEEQKRLKVLPNAIIPIPEHEKPTGKLKLIYMSVPERGLDILYEVFNELSEKYDIELEVFSSYKIYGIPQVDIVHRNLLDKVKSHPKIIYHGTVSNEEIHKALERAHIFAYPSTFLETSCVALIEAMSAGCLCVHSNIAGLPETSAGFTNMYNFERIPYNHIQVFKAELEKAIIQYQNGEISHLKDQKEYTDKKYSWDVRINEWNEYLTSLL